MFQVVLLTSKIIVCIVNINDLANTTLGSISAVFSSPVFDPPEKEEEDERGTAAGYRA